MTSKARSDSSTQEYSYIEYNKSGAQIGAYSNDIPFTSYLEEISSDSGKGSYNRCTHTRYWVSPSYVSYTLFTSSDNKKWRKYTNAFVGDTIKACFKPVDIAVSPFLIGRAFQAMRPKLEAEISIPNFLLELGELNRMVPSIIKSARNFVANGDVQKLGSEITLTSQFGINPLIGDIQALVSLWDKFNESYSAFVKNSKKPQVRHYKETATLPEDEVIGANSSIKNGIRRLSASVEHIVTMKYRYFVIEELGRPPDLLVLAKYAGFRAQNLAALWNAIPFSFMLDWVFKVGTWLGSFDTGAIPVTVEVLSCGVSTKYTRVCNLFFLEGPSDTTTHVDVKSSSLGTVRQMFYKRELVSPIYAMNSIALPQVDNLDIRELVLSWALLSASR